MQSRRKFFGISTLILGVSFAILPFIGGCSNEPPLETENGKAQLGASGHPMTPTADEAKIGIDLDENGVIELETTPINPLYGRLGDDDGNGDVPLTAPLSLANNIDFETPSLGALPSMVIDPYIDAPTGVTFTAMPAGFGDEVVGLVKNSSTSACVEPGDGDQKLATGRGAIIGFSGFPVKATFPTPIAPTVTVSVEIQMLAGAIAYVGLYDSSDNLVAEASESAGPPDGTCGYPGAPRARKVVTVTSDDPVSYAIIDAPFNSIVFVIDNFGFESAPVHLDIKPGSCPNPLNPKSHGVVPAAILGTSGLDVGDIDVSSLLLEGVAPILSNVEDVSTPLAGGAECDCTRDGPDGYDDLTLKFKTQDIVSAVGPVSTGDTLVLTLTGVLLDGTPLEAQDCMVVVGREPDFDFRSD